MGRRRVLAGVVVGLAGLLLLAVLGHRPILGAVGRWLAVADSLEHADAIVVVAGRTPVREIAAARLFREGWAPRVVLSRQATSEATRGLIEMGVRALDFQGEARLALVKSGVPPGAIVALTEPVRITETELRLVADTARARGWRRVILITSVEHTRRVKLIWSRQGGAMRGIVVPVQDECFPPDGWWRRRRCSELVLHEYLGLTAIYLGISALMR